MVVQRTHAPQVDHLGLDPLAVKRLGGLECLAQAAAVGDQRHVRTTPADRGPVATTAPASSGRSPSML